MVTFSVPLPTLPPCMFGEAWLAQTNQMGVLPVRALKMFEKLFSRPFREIIETSFTLGALRWLPGRDLIQSRQLFFFFYKKIGIDTEG